MRLSFTLVLVLLFIGSCLPKKSELVWEKNLFVIGSQSSPRAADLNKDGTLDIVMGAGKNEYQQSDQGILAFDGRTGELLWQQEAPDQVYGSATFYDVTNDGIEDVFIGGRSPHFKALNGRTGEVIWAYQYELHKNDPVLQHARFNFNNSVLVPDQNGDSLAELLTVNGGNSKAEPYSEKDRYPAVLILFDIKNGNIIAADTMPDGKESYMSPLCFRQPGSQDFHVLFGTGGETISGNLYMARLSDLLDKKLVNAKIIATENDHGFIAPPSVADISQDGYLDIIAISHGSNVFAIDGKDQKILWQKTITNTECSNSFAVGYFTGDEVPDIFTFVSKGQWPNSTGSMQIMLDGRDGQIAFIDSIGCTGFSSPVVYDMNNDDRDEVIISVNEFDCSMGFTGSAPRDMENKLIAIDFASQATRIIDQQKGFKNIFSTPWLGDLDHDGYLDVVHCQYYYYSDILSFLGMRVKRISLPVRMRKPVAWGAYMGTKGNGCFILSDEAKGL